MTTAPTSPPAESDEQQIYVPAVGQSVRVRAIPPKLLRGIQRKATRRGRLDLNELMVWKIVYGLEDPNFTEAQVRHILSRFGAAIPPIVDRIDQLSGTDEHLQVEARGSRSFCEATRASVMATAWLRRPSTAPSRPQGHERRRGCNDRQQGSRRTPSRSAGGGSSGDPDDGESEPAPRSWLDRFNRTASRAGLESHERLELYLSLPASEQAGHFVQLAEHERQERILDGDVWPEPAIPSCHDAIPTRRGSSRSGGTRHGLAATRNRDDVLDTISPHDYWPALTGEEVPTSGRVRCPMPGHPDEHPSCIVYSEAGRGFWCPVCGAGGTAIDLAAILTGISPRGEGYWRLREWVAERLLNAPIEKAVV